MLTYRHGPSPPSPRQRERRAGSSAARLREAFDGPREDEGTRLNTAQLRRQRERRVSLVARRQGQEAGRVWFEVFIALAIVVLVLVGLSFLL